jgi:spore maturation protein CgeB
VEELFLAPARARADLRFVLGGAMYPDTLTWPSNVARFDHVSPGAHSSFFCSSELTLNVTRETMRRLGYCPSGRLFEAAACGVPIVSDWFDGLDSFFDPSSELFVARDRHDVLAVLAAPRSEFASRARRARERVLECHTSARRALELEQLLWSAAVQSKNEPASAFQGA